MTEECRSRQKWLEERFNHVDTILSYIREAVEELKEDRIECAKRCNSEMSDVTHRLREVERKQARRNGAEEREKDSLQSRNVTWQMIVAFATALSTVGVFLGYLIGK